MHPSAVRSSDVDSRRPVPRRLQRAVATSGLTARAADGRHVRAVAADDLPAFSPGGPCFVGGKFVGAALRVCRFPAFACDFALLASIHRRETAVALRAVLRRHLLISFEWGLTVRRCAPCDT